LIQKRTWPSVIRALVLIILAGMIPLIALWNQNVGQIPPGTINKPLLVTLGFSVAVGGFWLLLVKSRQKAMLLAILTFLFCFSYGHIYDLLVLHKPLGLSIGFIKLLIAYVLLFAAGVILILKTKRFPKYTTFFWGIAAIALLLINLIPIGIYAFKTREQVSSQPKTVQTPLETDMAQRDIYYIVLDAYAREDVLSELMGFDNSLFLTELESRGFYLPDCALSNYNITEATIGSVLNFNYLQDLGVPESEIGKDTAENAKLIWKNAAWDYFGSLGYQFVSARGYSSFNDIPNSDLYLNYSLDQNKKDDLAQQRFVNLYLNTTIIRAAIDLFKNNPEKFDQLPYWMIYNLDANTELNYVTSWYNQNNYVFDTLEKLPEMAGDFLVYAHINSPHPPYVYRSDGSLNYPPESADEKTAYINTITFLNKRVLDLVDELISRSDPEPIIILQADHSIHMLTSGADKHKILSAYYLPGELNTLPYETITPVNNYPLIIRNYFDPSYELLPDMIYVKFLNDYDFIPASCNLKP